MSSDKMREEFEAAVLRDWPQAQLRRCDTVSARAGQYVDERIQHAWWGWQASRESLVINLPQRWSYREPDGWREDSEGSSLDFNETVEFIEARGLKVRP